MGLDMYAYTLDSTPERQVNFEADSAAEIHCWRKLPNLHGWMERATAKGGANLDFNCA